MFSGLFILHTVNGTVFTNLKLRPFHASIAIFGHLAGGGARGDRTGDSKNENENKITLLLCNIIMRYSFYSTFNPPVSCYKFTTSLHLPSWGHAPHFGNLFVLEVRFPALAGMWGVEQASKLPLMRV